MRGGCFGPHQTPENLALIYHKRVIFVTWFNAEVRAIADFSAAVK